MPSPEETFQVIHIANGIDSISIPSVFEKRVFIGGAYQGPTAHWLDDIRDSIIACRHTPIMARDYQIPQKYLRYYIKVLIQNCKLVILELSQYSGAVVELEFLEKNPKPTLCLWNSEECDFPDITQVSTTNPLFVQNNRKYANRDDIRRFVREFIMAW